MSIDDAETVRTWRNSDEVSRHMFADHIITMKEQHEWIKKVLADSSHKYWIVTYGKDDVGLLSINPIDLINSRCWWHFYIASPEYRGRGIGHYCEYFLIRYVFEELGLNKICGEVLSTNDVILGIHWSFGFQKEGTLRRHVKKRGEFVDVVVIGMLREEWEHNKPAIERRLREKGLL